MFDVMTLPAARDAVSGSSVDVFEVGYVAEDGTQYRLPLLDVWAVRFEVTAPVRRFGLRKGPAASAGALVVGHRWPACGLRVVAGTRSCDGVGLRPDGGGDRLAAVLAVLGLGGGPGPFARAGLLRALGGGGRLPAGGASAGPGSGRVRRDAAGV